jgi:hypothetical protein
MFVSLYVLVERRGGVVGYSWSCVIRLACTYPPPAQTSITLAVNTNSLSRRCDLLYCNVAQLSATAARHGLFLRTLIPLRRSSWSHISLSALLPVDSFNRLRRARRRTFFDEVWSADQRVMIYLLLRSEPSWVHVLATILVPHCNAACAYFYINQYKWGEVQGTKARLHQHHTYK